MKTTIGTIFYSLDEKEFLCFVTKIDYEHAKVNYFYINVDGIKEEVDREFNIIENWENERNFIFIHPWV